MIVLAYLLSLPLAVSTLAVLYEFLDKQPSTPTLRRLTIRIAFMLLMYLAAGQAALYGLAAAFTTVIVLHLMAFWGLRLAVRASRSHWRLVK